MKLTELIEEIKAYQYIYLVGHTHPDGDCIGATLSLALLLEVHQINTKVLLLEPPESYNYLPIKKWVEEKVPEKIDVLISMDASDPERLGIFRPLIKEAKKVINIDHHASNTLFGDINHVNVTASSTAEMVYQMIEQKELITQDIAKALYTGIVYDTGGFKHSNTKPSTLKAAAELIQHDIDFTWILNHLFYEKPLKALQAQGLAYSRLETYAKGQVVMSYITAQDFKTLEIAKVHTESIVHFMNEVKGVTVAVFFYGLTDTRYKISLRSKGSMDVCKVAGAFGGGGHIKASGASYDGSIEDAKKDVLKEIIKQLD